MDITIPFSGQEIDTSDDAGDNAKRGVGAIVAFVLFFAAVGTAKAVFDWLKETTGADQLEVPLA